MDSESGYGAQMLGAGSDWTDPEPFWGRGLAELLLKLLPEHEELVVKTAKEFGIAVAEYVNEIVHDSEDSYIESVWANEVFAIDGWDD